MYNVSMEQLSFLTGFPRSGSTLLCNILAHHKDIASTPSSPLCHVIENNISQLTNDPFFLAQLDKNGTEMHERLARSLVSFSNTFSDYGKKITIDKNRGWLFSCETVKYLFPNFKMVITLRDPRYIYASVEKAHRKTPLIGFPDSTDKNLIDNRASQLFSDAGLIGRPFKGLQNLDFVPNMNGHLYFWRYEDFLKDPQGTTDGLFNWLGVEKQTIDWNNLQQITNESDSWYRMKFSHKIHKSVMKSESLSMLQVSPIMLETIRTKFDWFYKKYYPDIKE